MARNVFFSFHYAEDCHRVSQIRNIGAIHGNPVARDNDWETITRGGDAAIEKWIGNQLVGTSCTVVLIGANTAGRKWITYEICQSWNRGNGVFGIYIHGLRSLNGYAAAPGANPFQSVTLHAGTPYERSLAAVAPVYNPWDADSKKVYANIQNGIEQWIEYAIQVRNNN
jgi:hypothetical protein